MQYYNHYTSTIDWEPSAIERFANELLSAAKNRRDFVIFLHFETEPFGHPHSTQRLASLVKQIRFKNSNSRIYAIFNPNIQHISHQLKVNGLDGILFFDYWMCHTLNTLFDHYSSEYFNHDWNPSTGKFLFLVGRNKQPRLKLLYNLRSYLHKHAVWSFQVKDDDRNLIAQCLPGIDVDAFVQEYSRQADDYAFRQPGVPLPSTIYQQVSFNIINESNFNDADPAWLTERVWISMLNRLPFLIAGDTGSLGLLQKWGFRTFQDYLPVPHYSEIVDIDEKINALTTNADYWINNINHHQESINQDVKHNHQVLLLRYRDQQTSILDFFKKENLNLNANVILQYNFVAENSWRQLYSSVRSPDWPECFHENEFNLLPVEIQRECQYLHGYQPRLQTFVANVPVDDAPDVV